MDISIEGFVQGVGFRPFIFRLAHQHQQNGWIANTLEGVTIALEGSAERQQRFLSEFQDQLPPFAEIKTLSITYPALENFYSFQIRQSTASGTASAFVLPDIAVCPLCIADMSNPASRYFQYPFTNCTHCGPRYSIMAQQPYDRGNTSMAGFKPCSSCAEEYQAIESRRFHAQTIACPECGPQLQLLDAGGEAIAEKHQALMVAVEQLHTGNIVAIKGIGGFQLLVDPDNETAVQRLRSRKNRPCKPLAIMAADLASVNRLGLVNPLEAATLVSPAAPIVLLKRRDCREAGICKAVNGGTRLLGVMLAYSPLHYLLLMEFGRPLVATSGNRFNEPICIGNCEAVSRLQGIADFFLVHDREILRPLDDSVVRQINGKMTVLRRGRGYTPFPLESNTAMPDSLAVGGHLKSTVAISQGKQIIVSQHLGDLDTEAAQQQFHSTIADLQRFYRITPTKVMQDMHEGYASSQYAETLGLERHLVQHHYAHVLSCMAEHRLEPPVLGVSWDGSGMGVDGTLWGGEFLLITQQGFQRLAHFRPFALPGGTKAIQEPRRAASGLLHEIGLDETNRLLKAQFTEPESKLLKQALLKQINCPRTTSAGRLFDAVASLLGLCHFNQYEGQAASLLEQHAEKIATDQHYGFNIYDTTSVIDWQPSIEQLVAELTHLPSELIAAKFHNTMAEIILATAKLSQHERIVLSGGCFQNAYLVEKTVGKLEAAGFSVYCHEKIPPNDGGLAVGQLYAAKFLTNQAQ